MGTGREKGERTARLQNEPQLCAGGPSARLGIVRYAFVYTQIHRNYSTNMLGCPLTPSFVCLFVVMEEQ
jgi:hypothetical protein